MKTKGYRFGGTGYIEQPSAASVLKTERRFGKSDFWGELRRTEKER